MMILMIIPQDNIAYSGATSIYASNFYVLTDDFNVYKCLYNNKSPSIIKPSGTSNNLKHLMVIYGNTYIQYRHIYKIIFIVYSNACYQML